MDVDRVLDYIHVLAGTNVDELLIKYQFKDLANPKSEELTSGDFSSMLQIYTIKSL